MSESLITAVQAVAYSVAKIRPPFLQITATGIVGSLGWKNPQLVFKGVTEGVLEYDFVAERPSGYRPFQIVGVSADAEYHGDLDVLHSIRVNSNAHSMLQPLGSSSGDSTTTDSATTDTIGAADLVGYKLRVLGPDDVASADFDDQRVTISIDDNHIITDLKVG